MDKLDLYTKALSLRKEFDEDSTSPIDIFSFVHNIPRLVLVLYPMKSNLSGMCINNLQNPVIAINSNMSIGRQRFSLAHELFHLYFDKLTQFTVCAQLIGDGNTAERDADQFASYFLMPPIALSQKLKTIGGNPCNDITIKEIVKLEQFFGLSRQALLYRLVDDNILTHQQAYSFRHGIIRSAVSLGYDDSLYKPSPPNKQYMTFGYYIQQAEEVLKKGLVSNSKYEQLLLEALRPDLVYGDEFEGGELID